MEPGTDGNRDALTNSTRDVGLYVLRYSASALTIVVPVALIVVGLGLALISAVLAERPTTEQIGTLGVELGAAMWFAGAVALGVRPRSTVRRSILLIVGGVVGLVLVVLGLVVPWHGVALGLSMEFGVGLIAIPIIDIVVMRFFYETARGIADGQPIATVFSWVPKRKPTD
jgi:hypothetical protein